MKLYHTSDQIVSTPDTRHSRDFLDFGKGFYLTTLKEQAEKYGERFKRRNKEAWLCVYELEYSACNWKTLQFDAYNKDWLRFVANCRAGIDNSDYDIVIGGIANDKVIRTLDRYFNGEIAEDDALGLLAYEKPNVQYCIRSQAMLDECLRYIKSELL